MKQQSFLWRAAVLAAGVLPLSAGAAVETFTASYQPAQTDYSDSFSINQFDPTLGTLQSITITAAGTAEFSQYYQNLSTRSAGSVTISQSMDMELSQASIGDIISDLNISSGSHTYSVGKYTGTPFYTAPSGGMQDYTVQNSSTVTLAPANFSPFIGSGMADFLISADGSGNSSNTTGNFLVGWSTMAGVDLTIVYNYTAAPEPATWASGIFALAGLGLYTVRRQRMPQSLMK